MERENTIRQVGINDILDASERINAGITYTDKDIIVIEHLEDMTERGSVKLSKDMIMIIACLEGKMQVNLNAKLYTLHPYEVLICKPNIIMKTGLLSEGMQYVFLPAFSKVSCIMGVIFGTDFFSSTKIRSFA